MLLYCMREILAQTVPDLVQKLFGGMHMHTHQFVPRAVFSCCLENSCLERLVE